MKHEKYSVEWCKEKARRIVRRKPWRKKWHPDHGWQAITRYLSPMRAACLDLATGSTRHLFRHNLKPRPPATNG